MMVYIASAYRATLSGLPSGYFAMRQGMIGLAGIVVMMLISCFNYQFYKRPVMQRLCRYRTGAWCILQWFTALD